jgi:hypothetical protein
MLARSVLDRFLANLLDQVVDMDSAILRAPNEVAIGQNANHSDITKFADVFDMNYRPVLLRLLQLGENISKIILSATKEICTVPEESDNQETSAYSALDGS